MTITTNPTRNEYTATAGQTVFTYTFKIFANTDLNVYKTAAGATANDTTDLITAYTVSGVGDEDGGTITLTTPASAGDLITIVSDIPASRIIDYQNNGDFRADVVNNDFDRVVSLVKQVEDLSNRSILFQESQQGVSQLDLPAPVAGQYFRWKSDLSGVENAGAPTITAPALQFTSYSDLRASTGQTNGDVAYISGRVTFNDGGQGVFVWSSSDLSTEVVADTQSGIYVAPNSDLTGVNGAWVRQKQRLNTGMFGCDPAGVNNDTPIFASMLTVPLPWEGIRYVDIFDGNYSINPAGRTMLVQSDTVIVFSKDAWMICVDSGTDISAVFEIVNVSNIEIYNPQIIGDAALNALLTEGAGHGMDIRSCTNVKIYGGDISQCYTDGIYLNNVVDFEAAYFNSHDNGRQGVSLISGENVHLHDFVCSGSYKNAPMAGIDIEPNPTDTRLKNVLVENFRTYGNLGSGLSVSITGTNLELSVTVRNHIDDGSNTGATFINKYPSATFKAGGYVNYENGQSLNAKAAGMQVLWRYLNNIQLTLNSPVIYNCNVDNGTNGRVQDVGLSIHSEDSGWTANDPLGNITIKNPTITMGVGRSVTRGIFIGYAVPWYNVIIDNPIKIQSVSDENTISANNSICKIGTSGIPVSGNVIRDEFFATQFSGTPLTKRNFNTGVHSRIIDTSTSGNVTINEVANFAVTEKLYIEMANRAYTCTVNLPAGTTITSGAATVVGRYYEIVSRSTLDFITVGAPNNNVGTRFICTAVATLGAGDSLKYGFYDFVNSAGSAVSTSAVGTTARSSLLFEKIGPYTIRIIAVKGVWTIT